MNSEKIDNPDVDTAKALMKQKNYHSAIEFLRPLAVEGQTNLKIWAILGDAYIKAKQPAEAIALLKPLHDSGLGNAVTTNTLGNAYLHDQNPKAAIALLKPLHDSGRGDLVTTNTLGSAAVAQKDHTLFNAIKSAIEPREIRDYLEAKLFYLDNQPQKALRVLQPYVEGDIKSMPRNMCSMFLNLIPAQSPLCAFLKQSAGEQLFARLMGQKELWHANPLRAELSGAWTSDGRSVHTLGGTPVSRADGIKAGVSKRVDRGPRPER